MADPAELVKLKLIFWHKDKKPGDIVEVRRDEVRSWYGFAELVDADSVQPVKADESADTGAQKTPPVADDDSDGDSASTPAARKTTAATASKAK